MSNTAQQLGVTIEHIVYQNSSNGYVVCEAECDKKLITLIGYIPNLCEGESLVVAGVWTVHANYGEQFKVLSYEKIMPKDESAIHKYLASGIIKGVRRATADKIVELFHEKAIEILLTTPERLAEIPGISKKKALEIGESFVEHHAVQNIVMFLQQYGITANLALKVYKTLGTKSIDEVKRNPYVLCEEVYGIGFKTADKIAVSMGYAINSVQRIRAGIVHVLSSAVGAGHTFLPKDVLCESAAHTLDVAEQDVTAALSSMLLDETVCSTQTPYGEGVFLLPFFYAERGVATRLAQLSNAPQEHSQESGVRSQGSGRLRAGGEPQSRCATATNDSQLTTVNSKDRSPAAGGEPLASGEQSPLHDALCTMHSVAEFEKAHNITLAGLQKEAVAAAMQNNALVITGGPGTGKTTIVRAIIALMQEAGKSVALAAPTGRAAKRLTEMCGIEAKTIHRLLEINFSDDDRMQVFSRDDNNKLDCDVLIVDEMSMVDILLMNSLVKAVKPTSKLIMVGDADQLPSVGAGCVLGDIINSQTVAVVRLTEIFRQAEQSMIVVNAHMINRGEYPVSNKKGKDFFFISSDSAAETVETIKDLCDNRLPSHYGYDSLRQIQVLTPMRKSPVGVHALNKELQDTINPKSRSKNEKVFGETTFRDGDKVMQIKNNYNIVWEKIGSDDSGTGVFNGDIGIIKKIDTTTNIVTVIYDDDKKVEYDFLQLDEIELAYAMTIHKSQGSEFDCVVMPMHNGAPMLMSRNLLYTAVTRAKSTVVLVGRESVVHTMVDNNRESARYSSLCDALRRASQELGFRR